MKGSQKLNRKAWKITSILVVIVLLAFFIVGRDGDSGTLPFGKYTEKLNDKLDSFLFGENRIVTDLENPTVTVHFIDVGQGEAILIKSNSTNILVDTGEAGQSDMLIKYLKREEVDTLDLLLLTHPHSDHMGGAVAVVEELEVGQIAMPTLPYGLIPTSRGFTEFLEVLDRKEMGVFDVWADSVYDFEELTLTVIAPIEEPNDLNNLSAIVRVDVGNVAYLLTGDSEKWAEDKALDSGANLNADILSVGHHGSNTSTSQRFLDAVSPEIAVISCAVDNSYGHPHVEVLERLHSKNLEIYRTDLQGTIVVATDGENFSAAIKE